MNLLYFYHLAKELHDVKDVLESEESAIERTIIDRTYYAIFLSYKRFLSRNKKKKFFPKENGDDHEGILKFITDEEVFANNSFKITDCIREISNYRGHASYVLHGTNPYTELGGMSMEDLFTESEVLLKKIGVRI